jgi:hypothetical protein
MDVDLDANNPSFQRGQQLAHEVLAARIYGEDWTDDPAPREMPHLKSALEELLTAFANGDATMIGSFCFVLARWASVMMKMVAEDRGIQMEEVLGRLFHAGTDQPW